MRSLLTIYIKLFRNEISAVEIPYTSPGNEPIYLDNYNKILKGI